MVAVLAAPFTIVPAAFMGPTWEHWRTVPGVFDVAGPRSDGNLVVAGTGQLFLVDPVGNLTPFARGPQGYADDPGSEAYITVSPGSEVTGVPCNFAPDDVYVLRLHAPLGITRIDSQGHASAFATIGGVQALNGIAFDTTGRFGYRLLVSGPMNGKTVIAAIDCTGAVQRITETAPTVEGGLAVAPSGFGSFSGDLIAPDELSGNIYAIAPDGTSALLAESGLPAGGDTGVEGVAFVPTGFARGGAAYYADRATPGNPHPGSDSLLRLSSATLTGAGVHEGDLLAVTEGGATMISVSCQAGCQVLNVVSAASPSHGEGHLAFTLNALPSPISSPIAAPMPKPVASTGAPIPIGALLALAVAVLLGAAVAVALVRRTRGPSSS
jgi:hypothetical protein